MRRLRTTITAATFVVLASCSGPQEKSETPAVTGPQPTGNEPECFQGCVLSSDGACQTTGNVMDWSSVEQETIDCDPRCCEGAPSSVGNDPDGDGIFADADQCPEAAEDYDGFQDDDGCPDPDNDGDGIPDIDDVCPLDAETVNGIEDSDGCPD